MVVLQPAVASAQEHCEEESAPAATAGVSAPPGPQTLTVAAEALVAPGRQAEHVAAAPVPVTKLPAAVQKEQVVWPRAPAVVVPAGQGVHVAAGPVGGAERYVSAGHGMQERKGSLVPFW